MNVQGTWTPNNDTQYRIRLQHATDPNTCANCGIEEQNGYITAFAPQYSVGDYKIVLYQPGNPNQVIAVSPVFNVKLPTGNPTTSDGDVIVFSTLAGENAPGGAQNPPISFTYTPTNVTSFQEFAGTIPATTTGLRFAAESPADIDVTLTNTTTGAVLAQTRAPAGTLKMRNLRFDTPVVSQPIKVRFQSTSPFGL